MRLGIDRQPRIFLAHGSEERIDLRQPFDLIAEELDAIGHLIIGGIDLDHVAAHAEGSAPEVAVIALVENLNQAPGDIFPPNVLVPFRAAAACRNTPPATQTVDAAYRGDDDRVAPLE